MPTETMETIPGKPSETASATSPTEKEQAVRLVSRLRAEIGTEQGTKLRNTRRFGIRGITNMRHYQYHTRKPRRWHRLSTYSMVIDSIVTLNRQEML
jgi:hypothetical protein